MCVCLSRARGTSLGCGRLAAVPFPRSAFCGEEEATHMQMSKPLPRDVMLANNRHGEGVFANAIEGVICA